MCDLNKILFLNNKTQKKNESFNNKKQLICLKLFLLIINTF